MFREADQLVYLRFLEVSMAEEEEEETGEHCQQFMIRRTG